MKKNLLVVCLLISSLSVRVATAGVYKDDLAKCMVAKTTKAERTAIVKGVVVNSMLHPAVRSLATIPQDQANSISQQVAVLTTELITERCKDYAVKAARYEGGEAIQSSFRVLGEVAGRELFANAEVAAGMAVYFTYIDEKRIQAIFAVE